jgi:hypothetical protein
VRWPPALKLISWSNELAMGQSPVGKSVSTEAEDPSPGNDC